MKLLNTMAKFGGLFSVALFSGMAALMAEEGAAAAVATTGGTSPEVLKFLAIGAALGIGLAAVGVGLGQGKAVSSAMEGISRNPQAQGQMMAPLILGLAFMEALVIFALIFGFVFKLTVLG